MKNIKLQLFYRDADNYKDTWDADVPLEKVLRLEPDEEGLVDLETLGLSMADIPMVLQRGYDPSSDHPFVTVERITYDRVLTLAELREINQHRDSYWIDPRDTTSQSILVINRGDLNEMWDDDENPRTEVCCWTNLSEDPSKKEVAIDKRPLTSFRFEIDLASAELLNPGMFGVDKSEEDKTNYPVYRAVPLLAYVLKTDDEDADIQKVVDAARSDLDLRVFVAEDFDYGEDWETEGDTLSARITGVCEPIN